MAFANFSDPRGFLGFLMIFRLFDDFSTDFLLPLSTSSYSTVIWIALKKRTFCRNHHCDHYHHQPHYIHPQSGLHWLMSLLMSSSLALRWVARWSSTSGWKVDRSQKNIWTSHTDFGSGQGLSRCTRCWNWHIVKGYRSCRGIILECWRATRRLGKTYQ